MFSGTYVIVFYLPTSVEFIGFRFNEQQFHRGYYIYIGSGLNERLTQRLLRQLKPPQLKKRHWHIDGLLMHSSVQVIKCYIFPSKISSECFIAESFASLALHPIKNFGDSDCRCGSHLLFFGSTFPL